MTESLNNAFSLASKLPESEQDAIAAWIVAEMDSDRRWDTLFNGSQNKLAALAREALDEHLKGETEDWQKN